MFLAPLLDGETLTYSVNHLNFCLNCISKHLTVIDLVFTVLTCPLSPSSPSCSKFNLQALFWRESHSKTPRPSFEHMHD